MRTTKIIIGGVSALALASIPAALSWGAAGWLGFTITAHGFERTIQQENRRAVYVAAPKIPTKAPLAFDIVTGGPVVVERADLEGETLTVYLRNRSHVVQGFQCVHWALKAPDGTLVSSGLDYVGDTYGGMQPGDRIEGVVKIRPDERAVALRLTISSQELSR